MRTKILLSIAFFSFMLVNAGFAQLNYAVSPLGATYTRVASATTGTRLVPNGKDDYGSVTMQLPVVRVVPISWALTKAVDGARLIVIEVLATKLTTVVLGTNAPVPIPVTHCKTIPATNPAVLVTVTVAVAPFAFVGDR